MSKRNQLKRAIAKRLSPSLKMAVPGLPSHVVNSFRSDWKQEIRRRASEMGADVATIAEEYGPEQYVWQMLKEGDLSRREAEKLGIDVAKVLAYGRRKGW